MNKIMKSILGVLNGVSRAFLRYPASMVCTIVVAISFNFTIATENLNNHNLLFALQLVFFLGAILNMAVSAAAQKANLNLLISGLVNLLGLIITTAIFLLVYLPTSKISDINTTRLIVATFISFISFIIIASAKTEKFDFNQMTFMTIKSFFVALIYTLVIILGLFFIAFAVESLLYNNLSNNVYSYIAIYSMLTGFSFFLGYFPSFKKDEDDEQIEKAIKYPRFIEVLFLYILIPLLTILSVVLLLWIVQILINGKLPEFAQLSSIFSGYCLFGLWLYSMVSQYKTGIAKIFKRVFPYLTILFLAFEAYAILNQISLNGVKVGEYAVSLIWIFSLISSVLIIFIPVVKNRLLGYLAIIILAIYVMPIVGFVDFPVSMQVNRLENVLIKNKMLENGKIIPSTNISQKDKRKITLSSLFIVEQVDAKKPSWFNQSINDFKVFKEVYGFDQIYDTNPIIQPLQSINMNLKDNYFDISDYQYALYNQNNSMYKSIIINGKKGNYVFKYDTDNNGVPNINVKKNGEEFISKNLKDYLNDLFNNYKNTSSGLKSSIDNYSIDEMSFKIEKDGVKIILIFNSIYISQDVNTNSQISYVVNLNGAYLAE